MNATMTMTDPITTIHPATRLGPVHYTVADLGRQLNFYQERLGFKVHWREGRSAGLGSGGADLLRLTEVPGARAVRGTSGLYHTAFLFPTRLDLAHAVRRVIETRTPLQGGSNHGTHLALYLPDAEGNGIELAWDFPRKVWEPLADMMRQGKLEELMHTMRQPLDMPGLLAEAQSAPTPWAGAPAETRVGHVHLHVAALDATARFYHGLLGFETIFNQPAMGGAFFSAGGYHHHIGTNIWNGPGAHPAPADATGLRDFTIVLADPAELDRVLGRLERAGHAYTRDDGAVQLHDPSNIGLRLVVDGYDG
jgi:catechol 2,3-dioxygenase